MRKNSLISSGLILTILVTGAFLLFKESRLTPETPERQEAVMRALAPEQQGSSGGHGTENFVSSNDNSGIVGGSFEVPAPVAVDIRQLPTSTGDELTLEEAWEAGLLDIGRIDGPYSAAVIDTLQAESAAQPADPTVQNLGVPGAESANPAVLNQIRSFKTIDFNQVAGAVPPDPIITVGEKGIIAAVNTSYQIYDKLGNPLIQPTTFAALWGDQCGTGGNVVFFDPFLEYDEAFNRYIIGITAYDPNVNNGDNGWACIAVSKTDDPADEYWLYSVDGNPLPAEPDLFFDYPHIGVGQKGLYLEANMFAGDSFQHSQVIGLDKAQMYAGSPLEAKTFSVSNHFTIQPSKIHGKTTGGWPTNSNEPHYYISAATGNNKNLLTVWKFSDLLDPAASFTQAGTVQVNTYNMPLDQPQLGGNNIQANDNRLLDVKYWGGRLYATHSIGCNGGTGTVNCVRWYIIDMSTGSPVLLDQGTTFGPEFGRFFPAIAPNMCGDILLGYTGSSANHFPGIYVVGREAGDPAGQVKTEQTLKAGDVTYTAFDSPPYRWGDYTGMAIDPNGKSFWYLGEYSRNQSSTRWSTYIGEYQWSDCVQPPLTTPTSTPTAAATESPIPTATTTEIPTSTSTATSIPDSTPTPTAVPESGFKNYLPLITFE